MKTLLRILILLAIIISILYLFPAFHVFTSITTYPSEWQGGIDMNSTIVWFVVATFGYGYLLLQSVLALFGLIFGFKRRKAAYWFFLLPGLLGIISSLICLGLFIAFDASWPASWIVVAILFVLPIFTFFTGRHIRKKVIPKPAPAG